MATPHRVYLRRRVLAVVGAVLGLVLIGVVVAVVAAPRTAPPPTADPSSAAPSSEPPSAEPTTTPEPTPTPTPAFDKAAQSLDNPASFWVVVNKLRPLDPQDYAPTDLVEVPVAHTNVPYLRAEASKAVVRMFRAITADTGLALQSQSAYRSYDTQVSVYAGHVADRGVAGADKVSARPGFSEHQTGLSLDISDLPASCGLNTCLLDTPEGEWLAANAYKYGFILRYPEGKTPVTGYSYEPWHYRFVGVELATEMHDTGIQTLEEFFGLPAAPDYAQ